MTTVDVTQSSPARRRDTIIVGAFAAFAIANLIHNRFGFDSALAPSALFLGLYWWRPRRGFLWAAAFFVALPAFAFLNWRALVDLPDTWRFLNHVALFLAGALALLSFAFSLRKERRP